MDNIANVQGLSQIASAPTCGNTLVDLLFVSMHYMRGDVINIPPIAGSDHSSQLIKLPVVRGLQNIKMRKLINYEQLSLLLSQLNWNILFTSCSFNNHCIPASYPMSGSTLSSFHCIKAEKNDHHPLHTGL